MIILTRRSRLLPPACCPAVLGLLVAGVLGSMTGSDLRAKEVAFESVPSFTASATTRSVTIQFDSPAPGYARLAVAVPRKGKKRPVKDRIEQQVSAGPARIELPIEAPEGPVEYSLEVRFPSYRYSRDFGRFGRGEGEFVHPTHLAISPRGELYVVDTGSDRVQVFDRHLNFLFQFGSFNPSPMSDGGELENGRFDEPWDLVITGYQELFITDQRNERVVRFDLLGRVISEIGRDLDLAIPSGIDADANRDLYVADTDNDRVVVFDRDGRFRKEIGSYGWGEIQFKDPTDVAVSPDGTFFVADSGNRRVQVFDRFQKLLKILKGPFESVDSLHLDQMGFLHVIDSTARKIFRFDDRYRLVGTLPERGSDLVLQEPTDCARAPDGTFYIVDAGRGQILVLEEEVRAFRRSGKLVPR